MELTKEEQAMLEGKRGWAEKKCMQILVALGKIYGAQRLLNVSSVQIAGVRYDNLGHAGLSFLEQMARDGRTRILATLNPAVLNRSKGRCSS